MGRVEAVHFPNTAGLKLYGTLHRPATPGRNLPAVVLLSPGVKMRVGPGRLYVPLTRMLNELGYTVLRFDFFGLGDSEGELQETMLVDVYNNIEVGRYVDDTLSAIKWLRQEQGFKRFILGGLCGGAITALLAAERDKSVDALLSLGMTVTLASNAATPAKYLTEAQLDKARAHYLRKLTNPRAWKNFLTFKSNYGVILRVIRKQVFGASNAKAPAAQAAVAGTAVAAGAGSVNVPEANVPAAKASLVGAASSSTSVAAGASAAGTPGAGVSGANAAGTPGAGAPPDQQRGNANPLFPRAFLAFLGRGGQALMLFSQKDRLQGEYEEKFAQPFAEQVQPFLPQLHKHVVPNANHVLSMPEWQQEMVDVSRQWLLKMQAA